MPVTLKIKRRLSGSAGGPSSLSNGELAMNETTDLLYYGKGDNGSGTATSIIAINSGSGGSSVPAGSITAYAGSAAPTGWLLCDGSSVNTYTQRVLHAIASNTFGGTSYLAGTTDLPAAVTTFNLPNLQQRFPLGKSSAGTGSTLGASGGAIDHSHTMSHTHGVPGHSHGMGLGGTLNITSSGTHTTAIDHDHGAFGSGAGSAHTHTNSISLFGPSGTTAGTRIANTSVTTGGSTNTTALSNGSESAHTHTIDVPPFTGGSSSAGEHSHPSAAFSGSIGLVTGGVSGDATFTSDAASTSTTSTTNPPFLVVNYIIKT